MKEVGHAEERMMKCHKENHLDHRVIENLPVAIKKGKEVKWDELIIRYTEVFQKSYCKTLF